MAHVSHQSHVTVGCGISAKGEITDFGGRKAMDCLGILEKPLQVEIPSSADFQVGVPICACRVDVGEVHLIRHQMALYLEILVVLAFDHRIAGQEHLVAGKA